MNTALATIERSSLAEQVAIAGDLSSLTPDQRMAYYSEVCSSIGLNPLTRPFDYLRLNGKMVLYAKRECTDQLRALHGVSITRLDHSTVDGITITTAYARDKNGREDADIGAVTTKGLQGDALANARMKAITKAKRRVTLAICGLGWLDETEVETIPNAQPVVVTETGEIVEPEPPRQPTPLSYADRWLAQFRAVATEPAVDDAKQEAIIEAFDRATGNEGDGIAVIAWALPPNQDTLSVAQWEAIENTLAKGRSAHWADLVAAADAANSADEG